MRMAGSTFGVFQDGDYRIETGQVRIHSCPSWRSDQRAPGSLAGCVLAATHAFTTSSWCSLLAASSAGPIVDGAGEPFQGVLVRAFGLQSRRRTDGCEARDVATTHRRSRSISAVRVAARFVLDRRVDRCGGARRGPFARAGIRAGVLPGHRARRVRAAGAGRSRTAPSPESTSRCRDIDGAGRRNGAQRELAIPLVGRVSLGVSHRSGSVAPEPRVVVGRTRGRVRAHGRAAGRLRPAGPGRAWSRHARGVRRRVHHCRRERPAADDDQDVGRRDARGPLRGRGPIESAHACAIDSRRADGHRFAVHRVVVDLKAWPSTTMAGSISRDSTGRCD